MSALTVAAFPRRLAGNPYCDLLYKGVAATGTQVMDGADLSLAWVVRQRGRVQVLHLHWPELYYRGRGGRVTVRSAAGFLAALLAARALGYRIVWTVHNALPHERRSVGDRVLRSVLFRVARLVVHADSARSLLPHGGRDAAVVPHGHYIDAYPRGLDRDEARRRLGLAETDTVFLAFGQVRAYKGIPDLLEAFAALDLPGVRLVIAGGVIDSMLAASIRREAARDPRVVTHLAHVADEDVRGFFEAADWIVLPYRDVLTSGSALLAQSCGRPVIAPRRGCLAELGEDDGMLGYEPDVPGALGVALARATTLDATAWRPRALAAARRADWDDIGRAYERVFVGG